MNSQEYHMGLTLRLDTGLSWFLQDQLIYRSPPLFETRTTGFA